MTTQAVRAPAQTTPSLTARWLRGTREFLLHAILQDRVLQRSYPGIMHLMIFWGMVIQGLGTVFNLLQYPLFLPIELPWPRGSAYLGFELVMDIGGLMIVIGVIMAALRRLIRKPSYLVNRWDDWYALGLLLVIALVGFGSEATRLIAVAPEWRAWSPIGNLLATGFTAIGLSVETIASLHGYFFWMHVATALLFVASLPFTKLRHLITGPLNIAVQTERAIGSLESGGDKDATMQLGAGEIDKFQSLALLMFDACVQCGRCEDVCPATISGMLFSPRALIQTLHESMHATLISTQSNQIPSLFDRAIDNSFPWGCTTCGACILTCPLFVNPVSAVVELRRYLVNEGEIDTQLQDALANLGRYSNSFGQSERFRAKWTQPVLPRIKDARKEPVDYLWFVGDYGSYHASLTDITRKTADVFQKAGLDFGILYDGERNSGNDARRAGEEGLFEMLVEDNVATLSKCEFKSLVTTDPHTFNSLKNEYPDEINGDRRILHYTELLDQLLDTGQLMFNKKLPYKVTYHDPCYLGRYNGVYDPPRRTIEATGCDLIEMPRCREQGFCCGAGGGRIWMEETEVKERPAEARIHEAVGLDGVQVFAVACPKDVTMFADAVKTTGCEESLLVKDIIELVHEAL
ncbi:MAG: 4Fe-4S dicluster domain-containing protein [Anaerolineales bacterium]|nr:4Fe-4S dicluster domain-containing protein [Anaerolineales bacterium]